MSGNIAQRTIQQIRQQALIDEIIGEYISLRRAGADALVGLCPFHEEKSPSFYVRPAQGYFHCFGCGEGGDIFTFIQKIEQMNFVQVVERLAAMLNIVIEYNGEHNPLRISADKDIKQRLIAANLLAMRYYQDQLSSSEARLAREFLMQREFTTEYSAHFGCGFAPLGWDSVTQYLIRQGFTIDELDAAGISRKNSRGQWLDRFRRRLIWPIKSITGDVIGFGARKIFDDDDMAKYINTPETVLYKKSSVLFGIDIAKKNIAKRHQVVIVEGYTDVMAMHAAGVTTAVAACGTAFGEGHIKLIRRLLLDDNYWRGEMIYTFDGDQAGRNAAIKAFTGDQKIIAQSFVSIAPDGMDPCDIRLQSGDIGVRDLIARRIPMVEFVLKSQIRTFDIATPEGRLSAADAAGSILGIIKDTALRKEYTNLCVNWLGLESTNELKKRIKTNDQAIYQPSESATSYEVKNTRWENNAAFFIQKQTIQCALQYPHLAGEKFDALPHEFFTDEFLRSIKDIISEVGGTAVITAYGQWIESVLSTAANYQGKDLKAEELTEELIAIIRALLVEPLAVNSNNIGRYVASIMIRAQEQWVGSQIATIKMQLHHINPYDENYMVIFSDLVALEAYRKNLVEQIARQ